MKSSLSLFTGLLILIFLSLGTWQVIRKGEKEALLETLAQSRYAKPIDINSISHPKAFQVLSAKGHFVPGKTIFLQSKTHEGKAGVYVLDVFQIDDGHYVLTQRGWAPKELTSLPSERVTIEGVVRLQTPPSYFQPENKAPTYFWVDLERLSKDLSLPLLPYYLVLKSSFHPQILPTDPIPLPRNNHLSYAITWYLLAFLLLIMLFYGRNKRNTS